MRHQSSNLFLSGVSRSSPADHTKLACDAFAFFNHEDAIERRQLESLDNPARPMNFHLIHCYGIA
jgi:hypothetical protein